MPEYQLVGELALPFRYYNMCIANLKKGGMGRPVSSTLTVDGASFATRETSNRGPSKKPPKPRNLGYREPGLPSQCKRSKINTNAFSLNASQKEMA